MQRRPCYRRGRQSFWHRNEKDECTEIARVSTRHTNDESMTSQYQDQELLPGIPDEVTLKHIVPKLGWRIDHVLSPVSRGWNRAIKSRRVFDARVSSQSTEPFVLINHILLPETQAIGLYSVREKSFYQLPPIPHSKGGIPKLCQCISLDGKVYVLGGVEDETPYSSSGKMYVMDLATQRPWERCASMKYGRKNFSCGVMGGRIYVSGGVCYSRNYPSAHLEAYDPKLDIWSASKLDPSTYFLSATSPPGNEVFAFEGQSFNPEYFAGFEIPPSMDTITEGVYFLAGERTFRMNMEEIYVYQEESEDWKLLHSFSPAVVARKISRGEGRIDSWTTLGVGNDLVMIITWHKCFGYHDGQHLLHSGGFCGKEEKMVWQKPKCPFKIGCNPFMSVMHL